MRHLDYPPVWLIAALGLVWVLQTRFILAEEARLRMAFGAGAEAYFSRVRRWF